MKNFVIAMTRQCGSGASSVAGLISKALDLSVYDRNLLRLASEDSGINEAYFANADEDKKKSLLYSVSRSVYNGELIPPESDNFLSNASLFGYQAKVLNELANHESYIVIGRAADFVLRDRPYVFSVFIYAPLEVRIQHEMNRLGMTYDESVRHVKKQDKYRKDYYAYHTGRAWEDMSNYDLCVNTTPLGYEKTANLIVEYVRQRLEGAEKASE